MKKRNLIILLLIPFIISLFGIVTINFTFNIIDNDILGINWDYNDVEGFKVNGRYRLEATGISDSKYPVSMGNALTWTLRNYDSTDTEEHAIIKQEGAAYYLETLIPGQVIITCSNEKGNIHKEMTGVIYEDGAIIINPKIRGSQNNISPKIYYGEYDLDANGNKVKAKFGFDIQVVPASFGKNISIKEISDNISMDLSSGTITVKNAGVAHLRLTHSNNAISDLNFDLNIVKDGINVYSYDDLMYCTNKSENGEIVVLRKSFESADNLKLINENNVELFGNYDANSNTYNFANEVYRFDTTFNKEYIEQWNAFAAKNDNYSPISSKVIAGLHVQKDFYGNGYTINLHNLTYPSQKLNVTDDDGNIYEVPQLADKDLFRGPLPFYTLGDPNGLPMVTAFGQDNVGMYVDGNNITVNDVNLKNCDFGNQLANLDTTGTVMDLNGNNIVVKNSRLSNGKNVLRSFSSNNISIDNCMLSHSRNFLITTGANEYAKATGEEIKDFTLLDGSTKSTSLSSFLSPAETGDSIVASYIMGDFDDASKMKDSMLSIDKALNDSSRVNGIYKGSMNINNTFFYQSGISAIAMETYFNGPFLFANVPSLIGSIFSSLDLVPLIPENVSGVSYPVKVNISGNTRFYDYKKIDTLDITGLISENISAIANSILDKDIRKITIDDIFPIKPMLTSQASSNGCIYTDEDGERYFNIPIAYYGGGLNLSEVTFNNFQNTSSLRPTMEIDLLSNYINLPGGALDDGGINMSAMKNLMIKTVTIVTGCQPFKFTCTSNNDPLLKDTLNKAPNVSILIENAKGE